MSIQVPKTNEFYYNLWKDYGKTSISWENNLPRDRSDFRERVRRETVLGKLTVFHENIEMYLIRQAKAYTTSRVFIHWVLSYMVLSRCKRFIYLQAAM